MLGGIGGVGDEGPCGPFLTGPLCRLCNVTDQSRYYNADESSCDTCGEGTYCPVGSAVATPCAAGTYSGGGA